MSGIICVHTYEIGMDVVHGGNRGRSLAIGDVSDIGKSVPTEKGTHAWRAMKRVGSGVNKDRCMHLAVGCGH